MKAGCILTPKSTSFLNCSCNFKRNRIVGNCAPLIILQPCAKTKCGKSYKVSSLTDNVKINQAKSSRLSKSSVVSFHLMWLSGKELDSRPRGRGVEPHRRHCVVSLSKNINPSLVLAQPRKTRPFKTERLLIGRKESNQTNKHST